MRKNLPIEFALAITLLFATGCGDSDGTQGTATAGTSSSGRSGGITLTVNFNGGSHNRPIANTDAYLYPAGTVAIAELDNVTLEPIFLPGCSPFVFEKSLDGRWEFFRPLYVCIWEGIAFFLDTDRVEVNRFNVPNESGFYRLRYDYSTGCDFDVPLSQADCGSEFTVHSNAFEVERELCDPAELGCQLVPTDPIFLCPDERNFSGPAEECTLNPLTDECGYEILACP